MSVSGRQLGISSSWFSDEPSAVKMTYPDTYVQPARGSGTGNASSGPTRSPKQGLKPAWSPGLRVGLPKRFVRPGSRFVPEFVRGVALAGVRDQRRQQSRHNLIWVKHLIVEWEPARVLVKIL